MVISAGASRTTRSRSSSRNIVSCLVDGCASDLSKCREYHKRHKVCEVHSKTPIVVVGGREQRFCQQCSRFHTLSEFDEGKRSCRKRLDGHNRRRRKPHLDTLNTGSLLASHQVSRFSVHPGDMHPVTTMSDANWVNFSVKSDHLTLHSHCLPLQSPFLQQSEAAIDTDRAFSLLSSSVQSSHINLSPTMYAADKIPIGQTLQQSNGAGLYPCFQSCMPMEDGSVGSNLVSEANGINPHCQDMFQGCSKVLFEGTCETPTLHWQW